MEIYDPTEACPKCGCVDQEVIWFDHHVAKYRSSIPDDIDFLKITCGRCGYEWHRLPVDAKTGKEASVAKYDGEDLYYLLVNVIESEGLTIPSEADDHLMEATRAIAAENGE